MGETSEGTLSVALNGTKLLLGLETPEYYTQRAQRFAQAGAGHEARLLRDRARWRAPARWWRC